MNGYLSLVLHAHLPYVRHPEYKEFLEEDWLYEAITETYIPLLEMFENLTRDNVPWNMTITMSGTLVNMMNDGLLRERYIHHINKLIEFCENEVERLSPYPDMLNVAKHNLWFNTRAKRVFEEKYGRRAEEIFKGVIDKNIREGYLEIEGNKLRLTRKGLFYGNDVFSEFLLD